MSRQNLRLILGLVALVLIFKACDREPGQQTRQQAREERATKEVDAELAPPTDGRSQGRSRGGDCD